ncbi:putative F-box/LRR-repeat protein 23 [Heracleum sosnowskyi]|uniref:F-box/LRR-repeat protein 23 n=1 Tax=Heracleum sosnowskyi TaxID=360622 RepID=A0AAD8MS49_9APIA|nr:putative F-box/LRR-repeat protein 23 [Heracleum sosnowskyi]
MGPTSIPPAVRNPNWQELPEELTTSFLERVGSIYLIASGRKVCHSWRQICSRPEMWRVVDLRISGYRSKWEILVNNMARKAVEWSCGQLIDFRLSYYGDNLLLNYISDRSSKLRCLHLEYCSNITNEGLIDMVKKLPLLEELHIFGIPISMQTIEVAGSSCLQLKSFKLNKSRYKCPHMGCDEHGLAIAENMPGLRHLKLQGNKIATRGLLAILKNCVHLESLDLRMCFLVEFESDEIRRLSPQIKDLWLPNDYTDDDEFDDQIYTCDTCDYTRPEFPSESDIDSDELSGGSDIDSDYELFVNDI